jgi:hypothetical protein
MSEFEYIDAYQNGIELIAMAAMDFSTLFFAYVVAAYLVGKSIRKPIAIAMSTIYSFFLLGPFAAMFSTQLSVNNLLAEALQIFPNSAYFKDQAPSVVFGMLVGFTPGLVAWIASLFYMHGYLRKDSPPA